MDNESNNSKRTFIEKTQNWVLHYPGFFTPYKSSEDFLLTLASPFIAPPIFTLTSCQCFAASLLLASLAIPVTLLAVFPSALFNKPEWIENTFNYMFSLAKDMMLVSLCYAALSIVSIVGAPIGLVTRSLASIVDGIVNLFTRGDKDSQLALSAI